MTSHTPGPWYWVGTDSYEDKAYLVGDCGQLVLQPVSGWDFSPADPCGHGAIRVSAANARVVAAAPALLAALKEMVTIDDWEAVDQARAAIAKAEGPTTVDVDPTIEG